MELKFDNNRSRVKYCPCGKSNKDGKFSPFKGFENKGKCFSCDEVFFPDKENNGVVHYTPPPKVYEHPLIESDHLEASLKNYENNNFVKFLRKIFGSYTAKELIEEYNIGTYGEATIFWQVDHNMNIRTGSIMDYNPETGKREGFPRWVHKKLSLENIKTCLFGLHLISETDRPIAIVESEKTAIIMCFLMPNYVWLATGGKSGLNKEKMKHIINKKVVLFPDQGCYNDWDAKANELGLSYEISADCEIWYEKGIIAKSDDIADYYLNTYKTFVKCDQWSEKEYNETFNKQIKIN